MWGRARVHAGAARGANKKTGGKGGQNMRAVNNTLREIILRERPLTVTNNCSLARSLSRRAAGARAPPARASSSSVIIFLSLLGRDSFLSSFLIARSSLSSALFRCSSFSFAAILSLQVNRNLIALLLIMLQL